MQNQNDLVVPENISAFKLLFKIEVGLREFFVLKLGSDDPLWWKHRLPGDILTKFREGRTDEKKVRWMELIPHHPIYYIDFSHLRIVIEKNDNWRDVFQETFAEKEVICSRLREIEPIRNKVAHNRVISMLDVNKLEDIYNTLSIAIGPDIFDMLIRNISFAKDLHGWLLNLENEAKNLYGLCTSMNPLDGPEIWEFVRKQWWFDDLYLESSIEGIKEFFSLMIEYGKFSRNRGSGYLIEAWINDNNIEAHFQKAQQEFILLMSDRRL